MSVHHTEFHHLLLLDTSEQTNPVHIYLFAHQKVFQRSPIKIIQPLEIVSRLSDQSIVQPQMSYRSITTP